MASSSMLPSDQDSSTILSPFFLFGHSCHFPGATVFALSDHTFITPAGAKLAIRSQAVGGKCQFLEGLDCWTTVSGAAMNDDKTHFAVIVKERIKGPTAAAAADDDDTSDGDSDEVHHDAAIIVYKLPTMQHGATTEEKNIDMKDLQSAVGSTAIIEASKEVTAPKRVRQIPFVISSSSDPTCPFFTTLAFSTNGKTLYCQTGFPDHTLFAYDWSRSKQLCSLPLEILASTITTSFTEHVTSRLCTTGPDHLCFWAVGAGSQDLKPLNPVKNLDDVVDGDNVTDHAWLYGCDNANPLVVCTTGGGKVVVVDERSVRQTFLHSHDGLSINCVLAFEEGTTGAASLDDADDVPGFLTLGDNGLFCLFHYNKEGDNHVHKQPYRLSQRFKLLSNIPGPVENHGLDLLSLSLGPDIGDACLLFISTPSGVITIDIGQLEAETDKDSFHKDVASNAHLLDGDGESIEGSITTKNSQSQGSKKIPDSHTSQASSKRQLASHDDPAMLPAIIPYKQYNYVSQRHTGPISSISCCARKPFVATSSGHADDSSVRVWNYQTRECIAHHYFPGLQHPTAVSIHPSGNEIIVGFDDNVKTFHICGDAIRQSSQIQVKAMIHVHKKDSDGHPEDKLIMNEDRVTSVKYSNDGGLFAVVTGKFVQIFNTYGLNRSGRPSRVTVLAGHAQPITDLHWNGDGLGLHTTDSGGAVYEWVSSRPDRIREVLVSKVNISAVGGSLHEGCLIATGGGKRAKQKEELEKKKEANLLMAPKVESASPDRKQNMFNPQKRQNIIANRKKSFAIKRQSMTKANPKRLGSGVSGNPSSFKEDADKIPEKNPAKIEKHKMSSLMGWSDNIETSKAVPYPIVGRVTAILCTKNDDYERNKLNYAFVCTGEGDVQTFEWGNAIGTRKPEEEGERKKMKEDSSQVHARDVVGMEGMEGGRKAKESSQVVPHCRSYRLHNGEIIAGVVSSCNLWLFTVGEDGCLIMSALTRNSVQSLTKGQSVLNTADDDLTLTDTGVLIEAMEKVKEIEEKRMEEKSHAHFMYKEMEEKKDKEYQEMEFLALTDVKKFQQESSGLLTTLDFNKGKSANDLIELEKDYEGRMVAMEAKYENRIAEDMSRYMELKNAYDDLSVAAMDDRVNLDEYHRQEMDEVDKSIARREAALEEEIQSLKEYSAYVKQRYDEVLENNDIVHDSEVIKMRQDGKGVEEDMKKTLMVSKGETNMMQRQNKVLRDTLENRNIKNYELQETIEKSGKRVKHMKEEEAKLIAELEKESARANKWESVSGTLKRQVTELEKVRKVLTHQLHELRGIVEPKEAKIGEIGKRLTSLEGEYENIVGHVAELEKDGGYKQKRIGSLSETTRAQRSVVKDKETALQGVVTAVNLCLQKLQETGDWKNSVTFLKKVIAPHTISSSSERIREGIVDEKEQNEKNVKLRRLLESKVESLGRELRSREGGEEGELVARRKEENVLLMEQLNEMRIKGDKREKEMLRLKNLLRAKGGAGGAGGTGMVRSKSGGGVRGFESEGQRGMRLLDEMLLSSREEAGGSFGGGLGEERPQTLGMRPARQKSR